MENFDDAEMQSVARPSFAIRSNYWIFGEIFDYNVHKLQLQIIYKGSRTSSETGESNQCMKTMNLEP